MPENQNRRSFDPARYEEMTTEELEKLLQLDAEACDCEELDADEILCILEVLTGRNEHCVHKTANEAWESFQQNYLPHNDGYQRKEKSSKGVRRWQRRWAVLAACVALVVCLSVVVGAVGWERIANAVVYWTKDIFSFSKIEEDPLAEYKFVTDNEGLQQLYDVIVTEGIEDPVVPMWLPEGYELQQIKTDEIDNGVKVSAVFVNGEESLAIFYRISEAKIISKYEKADSQVEQYEVNGISHYIFENKKTISVAWVYENIECGISAGIDAETTYKMIDSIYRGE